MTKVPFLDLRITDDAERLELLEAVDTVFRHGRLVVGPEVDAFERRVADLCGRRLAVGMSSGTDALYMALRAFDLGPGDEVITTSLSWIATANGIRLTGATPVFADLQDDLNLDPASVRRLITPRTRAIVPVHYAGKICRMDEILAIAAEHQLLVIEDAAQAWGATLDGRPAGSFGDAACFSMNAMKVLAACGDAGAVVTDRSDVAERLVRLRYNGTVNRETCLEPSLNGRLDTLQAAILLKRLDRVGEIIERRRDIAAFYRQALSGVVAVPQERPGERDIYYTFQIQTPRRDELKAHLEAQGIETKIQHPILMPDQPAYRDGVRAETTRAREIVQRILCIPAHEKLRHADLEYVVSAIHSFMAVRA